MPERQNYLIGLKEKLLPNEAKIIELKYTGLTFGKMNEDERWFAAQTLLLKIHAIKGWTIPVSEMMDILIDQFQHKLNESYKNVTIAEIEYAFRNSIDVKDWGKALNLSLIDEVMVPYLENRFDISQQEENLKKTKMIEEKTELTYEEMLEWIDEWKNKDYIDFDLVPISFYYFMEKNKMIEIATSKKWEYIGKSALQIKSILQKELPLCKTNDAYKAYKEFERQEKEGFDGVMRERVLNRAKKLIVYDFLMKEKENLKNE